MNHTAARRDRLARLLPDEGVDAFLISNPVNVTYLTGFTGDSSTVVLSRDRVLLVSDPRYVGQIADECPELETHIRTSTTRIAEASIDVLNKLGCRAVGFESAVVTVAEFDYLKELAPALEWKAAADRVERLRMVKDDDELGRIRDAVAVAQRAFAALVALMRPTDTEIELSDALEANVRRAGGEGTAFPSIVAVGERAALPHCPPTDRRVTESGLLLIDWGASVRGYKSDLTRVLATRTKSSFAQLEATDAARLQEIHAGGTGRSGRRHPGRTTGRRGQERGRRRPRRDRRGRLRRLFQPRPWPRDRFADPRGAVVPGELDRRAGRGHGLHRRAGRLPARLGRRPHRRRRARHGGRLRGADVHPAGAASGQWPVASGQPDRR